MIITNKQKKKKKSRRHQSHIKLFGNSPFFFFLSFALVVIYRS